MLAGDFTVFKRSTYPRRPSRVTLMIVSPRLLSQTIQLSLARKIRTQMKPRDDAHRARSTDLEDTEQAPFVFGSLSSVLISVRSVAKILRRVSSIRVRAIPCRRTVCNGKTNELVSAKVPNKGFLRQGSKTPGRAAAPKVTDGHREGKKRGGKRSRKQVAQNSSG
jgi:hypothetical protein